MSDVKNAYFQAPVNKKIWTTCDPEFGADRSKQAITVQVLYGLKSAGYAFINNLTQFMSDLGYYSCKAYPDVWMHACNKPNRNNFYEYVLLYVDGILCISNKPREVVACIDKFFPFQTVLIEKPDIYLGAKVSEMILTNGVIA